MPANPARHLKGRLLFWLATCAALILLIKTNQRRSLTSDEVQLPPRIQSHDDGDPSSRLPSRSRQMAFALDSTGVDLSYFENYFQESSEVLPTVDGHSNGSFSIESLSGPGFPYFSVNKTTNLFQHGCYMRGLIKGVKKLLPAENLTELGCEQRPPEAIVFGVKKGGTTTLKEFLAFHPGVSVAPKELKFLTNRSVRKHGLKKYASLMPYSLPEQIPIEKTPGYIVRERCAQPLKEMIPDCKLIAILSDPVHRAISDFVHLSWVRDHREGGASELSPKNANKVPHYEVKSTFEESVLYPNGSIKTWNSLLDSGMYYKYAKFWLQYFPRENFLYLDSRDLVEEPVKPLQELERFLGLSPFFSDSVFHLNETRGFYCIQYPVYSCMPPAKGRPHPVVDEDVIRKLQKYFAPFNKKFSELVEKKFSWTTYTEEAGTG